jgi:putative transposase
LQLAIGEAHRRFSRRINFREGWRGHLWQGRFASFILDEPYLLACARYVERNPVRAGLTKKPEQWRWSIAAAHMSGQDDILVKTAPLLNLVTKSWQDFLSIDATESDIDLFRKHERTGRPLGGETFMGRMERLLNRKLKLRKPGPKLHKK